MNQIYAHNARMLRLTFLAALPVVFLLLLRHQYMSTPQYAVRQFQEAMTNGDLVLLAQYTSPRVFDWKREAIERERYMAGRPILITHVSNGRAEEKKNEGLRRFGVRYFYTDKTHVEAILTGLIPPQPNAIISKYTSLNVVYFLVLTPHGWICDNVKEITTL